MAIKSKELAGLLGVSTATMSLVLNQKPGISDELRMSLLQRVREMGYGYMIKEIEEGGPPAVNADNIAYVILSEYRDEVDEASFFPPVLEGAEREARYQGYHFSIIHMYGESIQSLKETVNPAQFAGMIVSAERMDEEMKRHLDRTEVPYIALDCYDPLVEISSVTVNNRQGVRRAVEYLAAKGHRRIGYVCSGRSYSSLVERRRAFQYALEEAGLACDETNFLEVTGTGQKATDCLERLWSREKPPEALMVENDVLAASVYRALEDTGYKIPEDVSVVGFDGRSICSMLEPPLTTMRIPRRLLGRSLITLLRNKIDLRRRSMEDVTVRLELNAELVEMGSVRQRREDG